MKIISMGGETELAPVYEMYPKNFELGNRVHAPWGEPSMDPALDHK